jgi:hypothetical protein
MSSGYINMTDAHIHMVSNGTIYYNFLNTSTAAGITVTPGANVFTKAEMDLVTQTQNITGLGSTYITNGSMSMEGSTILPQQQIINGILNFEGDMILQNGNMTIQGTFDVGGGNFIEGPAILDGSLNINNGMMTGAGTISVSAGGYLQTVGDTRISNGGLSVQNGDMIMNSSGTYIGTDTLITGDLAMSGNVVNSGALTMSGTFTLLIPMSMTGSIVTIGISSMGSLGAITGVLNVLGNIVMSGPTVIIGVNNILGSMTVTSSGASIIGVSGLTGAVFTSSTPTIMDQSILEIPSGSLMGLSVSNIGILYSPLALLALGIMAIGSIFVLVRTIYIGYQDRRMLAQLPGVMLIMMREQFARLRKAFGGSSSGSKSEANTKKRSKK